MVLVGNLNILTLARLPVPPLPHNASILSIADVAFHQDFTRQRGADGKRAAGHRVRVCRL